MPVELTRRLGVALGMLVAMALPAAAAVCERVDHDGQGYVLCEVEAAQEPALRLWMDGDDGAPLRNFNNVRRQLGEDEALGFAMNAGMYHPGPPPGRAAGHRRRRAVAHRHRRQQRQFRDAAQRRLLHRRRPPLPGDREPQLRGNPSGLPAGHAIGADAGDRRRAASPLPARLDQPLHSQRRRRLARRADGVLRHLEPAGDLPRVRPLLPRRAGTSGTRSTSTAPSRGSTRRRSIGRISGAAWARSSGWSARPVDPAGAGVYAAGLHSRKGAPWAARRVATSTAG